MNKDKIIKDLKEQNRKLKNQYELQEVRLYSSQHKVDELKEENKRLNNIINELKKYINVNLFCYCEEDLSVFEDLKEDILNIINEDNKQYKLELEEWSEEK